eukprot:5930797-Pyramimonas_sp.AAC.3
MLVSKCVLVIDEDEARALAFTLALETPSQPRRSSISSSCLFVSYFFNVSYKTDSRVSMSGGIIPASDRASASFSASSGSSFMAAPRPPSVRSRF